LRNSWKDEVRRLLLANPWVDYDEIADHVEREFGTKPSEITVAAVRRSWREDIRFLIREGLLPRYILDGKRHRR
jgi:hypothetical protein